jgi:hypothetical protein
MSDTNRLAEITARFHAGEQLSQQDAGWLIADITIKQGLLARLEWSRDGRCNGCDGFRHTTGHDPSCWVPAELGHPPHLSDPGALSPSTSAREASSRASERSGAVKTPKPATGGLLDSGGVSGG